MVGFEHCSELANSNEGTEEMVTWAALVDHLVVLNQRCFIAELA